MTGYPCRDMSLLFPHDDFGSREKVTRLSRLSEEELAWMVSMALDEASGPWADVSDNVLRKGFQRATGES